MTIQLDVSECLDLSVGVTTFGGCPYEIISYIEDLLFETSKCLNVNLKPFYILKGYNCHKFFLYCCLHLRYRYSLSLTVLITNVTITDNEFGLSLEQE